MNPINPNFRKRIAGTVATVGYHRLPPLKQAATPGCQRWPFAMSLWTSSISWMDRSPFFSEWNRTNKKLGIHPPSGPGRWGRSSTSSGFDHGENPVFQPKISGSFGAFQMTKIPKFHQFSVISRLHLGIIKLSCCLSRYSDAILKVFWQPLVQTFLCQFPRIVLKIDHFPVDNFCFGGSFPESMGFFAILVLNSPKKKMPFFSACQRPCWSDRISPGQHPHINPFGDLMWCDVPFWWSPKPWRPNDVDWLWLANLTGFWYLF